MGCDTPLKTSFRQNKGFIGKLLSFRNQRKYIKWLGLNGNSYSKKFDKFRKMLPKNLIKK